MRDALVVQGGHDHFYKKNLVRAAVNRSTHGSLVHSLWLLRYQAKRVVKSGQEFQYLSVVKITVHGSGKPLGVTCDQVLLRPHQLHRSGV